MFSNIFNRAGKGHFFNVTDFHHIPCGVVYKTKVIISNAPYFYTLKNETELLLPAQSHTSTLDTVLNWYHQSYAPTGNPIIDLIDGAIVNTVPLTAVDLILLTTGDIHNTHIGITIVGSVMAKLWSMQPVGTMGTFVQGSFETSLLCVR